MNFSEADRRSSSLPFKRGIMNFDDFNYNAFNKYVLIKEPKERIALLRDMEERLGTQNSDK